MGLHGPNSIQSDDAPPQPRLSEKPPESGPLAGDGTRNSPVSSLPSHTPPAHTRRLSVSPLDGAATGRHVTETSDDEVEIVAYYPTKRKRKNTRTMVSDEDEHVRNPRYGPPRRMRKRPRRDSNIPAPLPLEEHAPSTTPQPERGTSESDPVVADVRPPICPLVPRISQLLAPAGFHHP